MSRFSIRVLVWLCLLQSSILSVAQSSTLTLRSAIDRALGHNPSVLDASEKIRASDAGVGFSLALALPQITLNGSANSKKDPLNLANPVFGGEPYNSYDVNLKFTQSLYAGGATIASYSEARKEQQIRTLDRSMAERTLVAKVIQTYQSILLWQKKIATLEKTRTLQQELLATTRKRLGIGRAQTLDVLQIETQLALIEPKLIQARNTLSSNAAELSLLLSDTSSAEFVLSGDLIEIDPASLLQKEKGRLLEIEKAGLVRDQGLDRKSVSLAKYLPRLDAVALWGRGAFVKSDLLDEYSTYWSVGLQFSVPVLSGLASVYERRALDSQVTQLDSSEVRVRDEQSLEQIRARQSLEASRTVTRSSKQAFDLSNAALREAQSNYRLATIDFTQFLNVQQSALEAELAWDQSKYDSILAMSQYCISTGIPLNELISLLESHR